MRNRSNEFSYINSNEILVWRDVKARTREREYEDEDEEKEKEYGKKGGKKEMNGSTMKRCSREHQWFLDALKGKF